MEQHIVQGIEQLPLIIMNTGCKRFLLVSNSTFRQRYIKDLIDSLVVEKVLFSDYTPNPLFEQICNGVDLFNKSGCDGILAIGGGSPIDVAKCIKLSALADEGKNVIIPPLVSTRVDINSSKIPLIAIPTTAGTGSESTHNAVMYYQGAKQTVTNDGILPDYAILDEIFLETLPLYQKKCTMMDALCQAIEAWWSVNSTEKSCEYSRKAIELIMNHWEDYIFNDSKSAAKQVLLASNYAGRAINITATTAPHAMSYKITSLYNLPHGHAVACCLPIVWKYMYNNLDKTIDSRGGEYLCRIFQRISSSMQCLSVEDAICKFELMMARMNLICPSLNNTEELDILAKSVNPVRLKNNPVYLSEEVLKNFYLKIISQA